MKKRILTEKQINAFVGYLKSEEKSNNTIMKYVHDVRFFSEYLCGAEVTKEMVIDLFILQRKMGTSV